MASILVVDDHPLNREVIASLLRPQGHTVLEASHGEEALERVRTHAPDLVITDILMPLMDGYEFVRRLRSDSALREIPVIFYSANYLEAEALDLARAYGISQVIRKPFEPEDVLKIVEDALQPNVIVDSPRLPSGGETLVGLHLRVMTNKLSQKVTQLEELNGKLEETVTERTAELASANRELLDEIAERRNAENALLQAHNELALRAAEMEHCASEQTLLAEMGKLLQSCVTSEEARQVMGHCLQKLFPADAGIVYLCREFDGVVEAFARWNVTDLTIKEEFDPQECWGLRRGQPHMIQDVKSAARCAHLQGTKEGGSLCVPMIGQGQSIGVFHMVWKDSGSGNDTFRPETRERLAVAVADTVALAIANIRLREKLKDQSIRDSLTGLYNRRYLEDSLNREICRARRAGASIGIIMLDVDNFKQFNDSFGHLVGDALLRGLGAYLKEHVRPEDIASRFGGEEFTLVLPGACLDITKHRAETLCKNVSSIQLPPVLGADALRWGFTLSFGVAVFPEHGASVERILLAADEALYLAKRGGRNCVVVAGGKTQQTAKTRKPRTV